MTKRADEPAFPVIYQTDQDGNPSVVVSSMVGLTKRELFAAMAMTGITSLYGLGGDRADEQQERHQALIAQRAVETADALLTALEGESDG